MKYIVYLTINLINNHIYIGQHGMTDDEEDDYLGNGIHSNKPWTYKHPKYPFHYAVKKYGPKKFKRIILAEFDTLEEALKLEATLVNDQFIAREDTYNVALGGGALPKTTKKLYQYSLSGEFIRDFDSVREMERILGFNHSSVQNSIRFKSTSHGYLWSYEKVDKLNIEQYSIYSNIQNIYLYNSDLSFYKVLNSIKATADELQTYITHVSHCINSGSKCKNFYISKEYHDTFKAPEKITTKDKIFYQYTAEGNFVAQWNSIEEIKKYFNLSSASKISTAIKKHTCCCGYLWSFDKYDKIDPVKTIKRAVGIYKDGELIESFDSVASFKKVHSSAEWAHLKNGSPTKDGRLIKYLS